MSIDVLANFCTSLRNAIAVKKRVVECPHSTLKERVAVVMKEEGYLKDFQVISVDHAKKTLRLFPRYVSGVAAISEIKSVSKASCRVYKKSSDLVPVKNGWGIRILSTNKGVMSDVKAKQFSENGKKIKLGGEVICSLW